MKQGLLFVKNQQYSLYLQSMEYGDTSVAAHIWVNLVLKEMKDFA